MVDLSKLNVCFLAGTLGQGGAERQLFYMLKTLRQCGAQPRLLCLTRGEFWEERLGELGVAVTWVGQSRSRLLRLRRIVRELRQHPPEILQSQHFYTNLYVVAAARALGLREVGAMRNDGLNEVRVGGLVAGRLSLRLPRVIAANSRAAIRNAIALGVPAARLYLLPNVVDTDQFAPTPRPEKGPVRLIAVGRLVKQKRLDRFLSILAALRRRTCHDVRAVIVGDGPERRRLEQQAVKLGLLPGTVQFRGAVPDMGPVYREADVLVLTSDWEGTPNVLLEAMASGLPVVATRVGDVPEILQHGETGYLADPDGVELMVEALFKLIDDPHARGEMGRRARQHVVNHHSLRQLAMFLEDLYQVA